MNWAQRDWRGNTHDRSAHKGNPAPKAAVCHQGGSLSAMRVAAATRPLIPAIRPLTSKNSAAAVPVSRPPASNIRKGNGSTVWSLQPIQRQLQVTRAIAIRLGQMPRTDVDLDRRQNQTWHSQCCIAFGAHIDKAVFGNAFVDMHIAGALCADCGLPDKFVALRCFVIMT